MNRERMKVSAAAAALAAVIYYIADADKLLAVLIPVAVHELGHIIVLRLLGLRITGFRAELKGFCIDYCGYTGAMGHVLAAVAGPAFGLAYALAASAAAVKYESPWLELTAGVSLLLSAFNLLPALPLDGGRVLDSIARVFLGAYKAERLSYISGLIIGTVLLAAGIYLMLKGQGIALALAAVWLLMYQNSGEGIVKRREIL